MDKYVWYQSTHPWQWCKYARNTRTYTHIYPHYAVYEVHTSASIWMTSDLSDLIWSKLMSRSELMWNTLMSTRWHACMHAHDTYKGYTHILHDSGDDGAILKHWWYILTTSQLCVYRSEAHTCIQKRIRTDSRKCTCTCIWTGHRAMKLPLIRSTSTCSWSICVLGELYAITCKIPFIPCNVSMHVRSQIFICKHVCSGAWCSGAWTDLQWWRSLKKATISRQTCVNISIYVCMFMCCKYIPPGLWE